MRLHLPLIMLVSLSATPLVAGEYNAVLSIGDQGPAWKDLPGVDGKPHSLADLADTKFVVLVFMANSCDVARDYEDRLAAFAKQHAGQVALVAINANRHAQDTLEKMKERAEAKQYPFPYLRDESQQLAKDYGATTTPEFFLLGPDRKLLYTGAMDDSSTASQVKQTHLNVATASALKGEKITTAETPAIGCRIVFPRERR